MFYVMELTFVRKIRFDRVMEIVWFYSSLSFFKQTTVYNQPIPSPLPVEVNWNETWPVTEILDRQLLQLSLRLEKHLIRFHGWLCPVRDFSDRGLFRDFLFNPLSFPFSIRGSIIIICNSFLNFTLLFVVRTNNSTLAWIKLKRFRCTN